MEESSDIVIITECDFETNDIALDFKIDGYSTLIPKNFEKKIRTITLVANSTRFKEIDCDSYFPFTSIEIQRENQGNLNIIGIYREINKNNESQKLQLQDLNNILTHLNSKSVCVIGDFNLDANKLDDQSWTNASLSKYLKEICVQNGLSIVTPGPTFSYKTNREDNMKFSALDYALLTEELIDETIPEIITCGFSDHQGMKIEFKGKEPPGKKNIKLKCRGKIQNEYEFQEQMNTCMESISTTMQNLDINDQASLLVNTFQDVLDIHAPWKEVKVKSATGPNISKATRMEMKTRNTFKNRMFNPKLSPIERQKARQMYKTYRNKVTRMIRNDKQDFVQKELSKGKNCWNIAKTLLGKTEKENISEISDGQGKLKSDKEIAICLNTWFQNKTHELKKTINSNTVSDPLQKLREKMKGMRISFSFKEVSTRDVSNVLSTMKTSRSSGIDGISTFYLKKVKKQVTPILTTLVNNSFKLGQFPEIFKSAKITPIWKKKGEKSDKKMYRPISGLCVFGKVIECIAEVQLRTFLEKYGLLGHHQHGFRKSRSTNTALLSTYIKLKEARENKMWQGILCFDLSAAYDVLDPYILLQKLSLCGVSEITLKWMASFLLGRRQAVQINQTLSPEVVLEHGIPQGSSISCLLFIFFVADYPLWINTNVQSFADDTIIYTAARHPEEVLNILQNEAKKTFDFFASNGLVANPGKTSLMIIRPKGTKPSTKIKITLEGKEITESTCERILGIKVSNNLQWEPQIAKVKQKINHGLYLLKRLQTNLDRKSLKVLSEGLVTSHLRYCNTTYLSHKTQLSKNEACNKDMKSLQILQNKLLRIVLGVKLKDKVSISSMLDELGMLSVNQMVCMSILMETWKALNLGIESISRGFKTRNSKRFCNHLQEDKDPHSYISKAARLYNLTSDRFKNTNLTKVAQQEAKKLVKTLPI